ncbi:hypothetical protein AHAS_Ahas13G0318700 [Arachis hypogaea]
MPSTPSGTPKCLGLQPLLWKLELACHALMLKWHAQVMTRAGVPRLRYQVSRPSGCPFLD